MFKKLTKADREKIIASRTGFLPMSAIEAMLMARLKEQVRQREQIAKKPNSNSELKTGLGHEVGQQ